MAKLIAEFQPYPYPKIGNQFRRGRVSPEFNLWSVYFATFLKLLDRVYSQKAVH